MERINQFDMYEVGKALSELFQLNLTAAVSTNTAFLPVWQAKRVLEGLMKGIPCSVGFSKHKCQEALNALSSVVSRYYEETGEDGKKKIRFPSDDDQPISPWTLRTAVDAVRSFETVFAEEVREEATYRVPGRGIYSIPKLVDVAEETFPESVLVDLTVEARTEWRAAGRCLAFNLLSACGFHVARCVEVVLRDYYHHFTGKDPTAKKNWGDYIGELEKIATEDPADHAKPMSKTIAELKQMKDDYRNPIMHPRIVLHETDARMLFANGETAIIAMVWEMKTRFGIAGPPATNNTTSILTSSPVSAVPTSVPSGGTTQKKSKP